MADFYTDLAGTANELFSEFGALVTHVRYGSGGGSYDPSSGVAAPPPVLNIQRRCIITDQAGTRINPKDGQTLQDGTLIQGGDKWIYLATDGPPPLLQDHLIVKGIEYVIKDIQTTGPGGTDILYLIVIRQ
jgi:hypothetical protein